MVRFGGCGRFLWNALLAEQNEEYREYMEEIESRLTWGEAKTADEAAEPEARALETAPEQQAALYASDGRCLIFSASQLQSKTTRATIGVAVMTLKKNKIVERAVLLEDSAIQNPARYRAKTLPAAGALLREEDTGETQIQMNL